MKYLKCVYSDYHLLYSKDTVYQVLDQEESADGRILFSLISENGNDYMVPLDGEVWKFEVVDISLEQMYFYLKDNEDVLRQLIILDKEIGMSSWESFEYYSRYVDHPKTHAIFYTDTCSVNGVDGGNVAAHKPEAMVLYEVSGKIFLEAFKEKFSKKVASPRFHKKRQPVPKRTVRKVVIEYTDGQSYTLKNVTCIALTGKNFRAYISQEIADGISENKAVTIEAKVIDSITVHLLPSENTMDTFITYDKVGETWSFVDGKFYGNIKDLVINLD